MTVGRVRCAHFRLRQGYGGQASRNDGVPLWAGDAFIASGLTADAFLKGIQ